MWQQSNKSFDQKTFLFLMILASENPHMKTEQDERCQNPDGVNEGDKDEHHKEASFWRRHLSRVNRHLRDASILVFAQDADQRRADVGREVAVARSETSRPWRLRLVLFVAAAERDSSCPDLKVCNTNWFIRVFWFGDLKTAWFFCFYFYLETNLPVIKEQF